MSTVRLSVCIPVFNFGAFLGPTLESIVRQATEEVEIVVLDGGSTDDTPEVVARVQARFPRLHYRRRPARGGIDRDMALAVAEAHGEYCWIFSGDDLMRPDAVARVLAELPSGCDVYLLESMLCDRDMRPLALHRMARVPGPRTFRLHDDAERREYCALALNTAAFFSFCGALVVRKARWDAAPVDESWFGSCWAHVARILGMLPGGLTVRYLPGPFLDKRGGNDSFNTRGYAHRYGIAIDGYHRLADDFFGHGSEEAFHLRRAVRAEQPWTAWLAAKAEIAETGRVDQYPLYNRLLWKQYADPSFLNWSTWLACRLAPAPLLKHLKRAWDARVAARRAEP
jgi:abequosyltransferase